MSSWYQLYLCVDLLFFGNSIRVSLDMLVTAIQIAPGLANLSITGCGSDDPELKEEMEKQFVDLLTEELKLQEAVADEHSHHMNVTLAEAKGLLHSTKRRLRSVMLPRKFANQLERELKHCCSKSGKSHFCGSEELGN